MTHRFRTVCLAALFVAYAPGSVVAQTTSRTTASDGRVPSATTSGSNDAMVHSRAGLREQPSFWEDSVKEIEEGGWDVGSWLAYRRRLLVAASLTNRYFWFCITSFLANVVLLYLFYASRVSEERKLWKATAVMTDLWNWALFADWTARNAIDKFNVHMERCARAEDKENHSPTQRKEDAAELARVQTERDGLRQENSALLEQLAERDRTVTNLGARIDEVARNMSKGEPGTTLTAQLMEKVNLLTAKNQQLEQQLQSAQDKLRQFAEGVA